MVVSMEGEGLYSQSKIGKIWSSSVQLKQLDKVHIIVARSLLGFWIWKGESVAGRKWSKSTRDIIRDTVIERESLLDVFL
jgi:hypothetical protein